MPCRTAADIARLFVLAATGQHLDEQDVIYTKGKHVLIESAEDDRVPVQLDGDSAGHTPLRIDLLPVRVPFIVPAK